MNCCQCWKTGFLFILTEKNASEESDALVYINGFNIPQLFVTVSMTTDNGLSVAAVAASVADTYAAPTDMKKSNILLLLWHLSVMRINLVPELSNRCDSYV